MAQTPLTWTIENGAAGSRVALAGEITERAKLATLLSEISQDVTFDLEALNRINSCGTREWISFVSALRAAGHRVTLDRCSTSVVGQLNMISTFSTGCEVSSVLAPYHCEGCNQDHLEVIDLRSAAAVKLQETLACPACGKSMEFDDVAEQFLGFHNRRAR